MWICEVKRRRLVGWSLIAYVVMHSSYLIALGTLHHEPSRPALLFPVLIAGCVGLLGLWLGVNLFRGLRIGLSISYMLFLLLSWLGSWLAQWLTRAVVPPWVCASQLFLFMILLACTALSIQLIRESRKHRVGNR
jgi:hypothetical protein